MNDDVFPDRNMDHLDKIRWIIETQGWAAEPVAPVEAPEPQPAYTYSVGFEATFAQPEVVVLGLRPVAARGLLGVVADQHRAGVGLPVGQLFAGLLDGDLRCCLLRVDPEECAGMFPTLDHLTGGDGYRVQQFVWPDRHGILPWEDGYDERLRLAQPVVGHWD